MFPSSSMSQLPSQSTFKSSEMPAFSVFVAMAWENLIGTAPRSTLVKCRDANGPGSIVLNIGSAISLIIWLPATLILGHSCATMSLRKPTHLIVSENSAQRAASGNGPPWLSHRLFMKAYASGSQQGCSDSCNVEGISSGSNVACREDPRAFGICLTGQETLSESSLTYRLSATLGHQLLR